MVVLLNHIELPEVTIAIDGSLYEHHPKYHKYMMEIIEKWRPQTKVGQIFFFCCKTSRYYQSEGMLKQFCQSFHHNWTKTRYEYQHSSRRHSTSTVLNEKLQLWSTLNEFSNAVYKRFSCTAGFFLQQNSQIN